VPTDIVRAAAVARRDAERKRGAVRVSGVPLPWRV
jgi:hypothetical protein